MPRSIASTMLAGDLDGDGTDDLVTFNRDSNDVSVLLNQAVVCQANLGFGGPGNATLTICGDALSGGHFANLLLTGAAANSAAFGVVSSSFAPTPFFGSMLVPVPIEQLFPFTTSATGHVSVPGLPGGGGPVSFYVQFGIVDGGQPFGFALSNALRVDFLP